MKTTNLTFEEALKFFREGEKIRRRKWFKGAYLPAYGDIQINDILDTDWEVCQGKPKIIEEWLLQNGWELSKTFLGEYTAIYEKNGMDLGLIADRAIEIHYNLYFPILHKVVIRYDPTDFTSLETHIEFIEKLIENNKEIGKINLYMNV
jgi:hypothetical protein